MCAKVLTSLIKKGVDEGKITGLKVNSRAPAVTHVMYVDDLFIFGKAEESEIRAYMDILQTYAAWSGQTLNKYFPWPPTSSLPYH